MKVGWVGVRLCVTVMVGEEVCVAVGDSSVAVCVAVGDDASEGVAVAVGVASGGGFVRGIRKKARRRSATRAGIPNLSNDGGSERNVF